ncbi:hypothetical protein [Phytohabitans houttuyneae]|uniref:Uncharacterized protein n=1 Tax=Phytohabitans houttuyneae TaxID=1076126 RepID=A0A6V8KH99_9ACTN|nr:hypothetical protein [Phytohabitans houttuyneae]GFJ80095.1 hypothetical protein Phou_042750 [Phytohabitans houttuyneae]
MTAQDVSSKPVDPPPSGDPWWRKVGEAVALVLKVLAYGVALVVTLVKGCGPT